MPSFASAVALVLAFSCAAFADRASAQDDDLLVEEPDDSVRLEAWLSLEAERSADMRPIVGVTALGVGLVAGIVGGWLLAADWEMADGFRFASTLGLLLGVLDVGLGVLTLARTSEEEDRFARFRSAKARGLTLRDVANFEGELRSAAVQARRMRQGARWVGVSMLAAGALTLGLSAAIAPDEEIGYWMGGTFAASGLLALVLSWVSEPVEDDWEDYSRGLRPHRASVSVTPLVGASIVGVGVSGAF